MKKFIRRLLLFLLVLVIVLGVAGYFYRSSGRQKWQQALGGLQSKGEKLSLAELSAPVATNADEFVAILKRATQDAAGGTKDLSIATLLPFTEPGRVSIAWRVENPTWLKTGNGGAVTWMDASNFVAQISPALADLREALKSPPANLGEPGNASPAADTLNPEGALLVSGRMAAQRLALAALVDLHYGRRADALADTEALANLCAVNRDNYRGPGQAMRIACVGLGLELTWQILQAADWNDEQLLVLQRAWQGVDALDALEKAALSERAQTVRIREDFSGKARTYPSGAPVSEILRWTGDRVSRILWYDTTLDADLAVRLRHTQTEVELFRSLRTNASWKTISESLEANYQQLQKKAHVPQVYLFPFSLLSVDLRTETLNAVRVETERRLTLTAIAARRYRVKNGRWPPTLETLTPEFLASTPRDCMNGQPLHYQAGAMFILYSVGDDGRDNGGDPSPAASGSRPGWWGGRDTLWPSPAK